MGTIREYREDFYEFSGKASDLNRQLAFAGIALIWLFKKDIGGTLSIPPPLILPSILLVLSLIFDMLHYCVAALIWRCYYRNKEKADFADDDDLGRHSVWLELPIMLLFAAKIVCIVAAYVFILIFLAKLFLTSG